MIREEIIKDAAADHRDTVCCGFDDPIADAQETSFIVGAEWEHKRLVEKACERLSNNKDNYIIDVEGEILIDDQIIKDFRKAMEE